MSPPIAIAIVGAAGAYGQARDLAALWQSLRRAEPIAVPLPADHPAHVPGRARRAALLGTEAGEAPLGLDQRAFGRCDPQTRVFVRAAAEALDDAALRAHVARPATVGVFAGVAYDHGEHRRSASGRGHAPLGRLAELAHGCSTLLDLAGPSLTVTAHCASALVAVHQAMNSLIAGDCEWAIAGGVHADLGAEYFAAAEALGVLSLSGAGRPLDARADGFVPGEGVGVVILERLESALAAGRPIRGVIRGSALVHAGADASGLTLAARAVREAVERALRRAAMDPAEIVLVEPHAVGARLDDAVEIATLASALDPGLRRPGRVALSSVKAVTGHLESAAGVAGLHKILLGFQHGALAPLPADFLLGAAIELEHTPFYTVDRERPLEGTGSALLITTSMLGLATALLVSPGPPLGPPAPSATAAGPVTAAPPAAAHRWLLEVLAREVPDKPIVSATDRFLARGLDSIELLRVTQAIEAALGIALPDTLLFEHGSIAELAAYLSARLPPDDRR